MPGYGILGPGEGTGLLPWSWAEERLTASPNYWVATVWPDGRPHVMPVWGVWEDAALWFSSSVRSRKARNLRADPRCVVTAESTREPVVLEGEATIVSERAPIARVLDLMNAKYSTSYPIDFLDPAVNATFRVDPRRAFGLTQEDFAGSPTRWEFEVERTTREETAMEDRFERGRRRLAEVDGEAGAAVIAGLADIAPDLGRYVVEFAFGDVYSRPGLSLRDRQIATVAALTALGTAQPQLRVHIGAALNVGLTREEIVEVITQMAVYAGFPAALNGIAAARNVFAATPDAGEPPTADPREA